MIEKEDEELQELAEKLSKLIIKKLKERLQKGGNKNVKSKKGKSKN